MCIRDSLRIDTITENVCGIIDKQTELICEEFILVVNTFVITNDTYKKVINIKDCLLYTSRCV